LFRVFISTAEVSGDVHGAALIRHLNELHPGRFSFEAIGGPEIAATGTPIYRDLSTQSSIGIIEGLRFLFSSLGLFKDLRRHFRENKIDLVILIDGQGRNIPIGKEAQKAGLKTIYYFPPPVSIWGKWNVKKMLSYDLLLCPFQNDAEIYNKAGGRTLWTGHPFSLLERNPDRAAYKKKIGLNLQKKTVALFPGSRFQEIETLTGIFMKTARLLLEWDPDLQFVLSLSHPAYGKEVREWIRLSGVAISLVERQPDDVMKASDFLITASGTATLQAAYYALPMAICYKISWSSYWIYRVLVDVKYIGLPNLAAGREVCREFIQRKCNPQNLFEYAKSHLGNEAVHRETSGMLSKVREALSTPDPFARMAKGILSVLEK